MLDTTKRKEVLRQMILVRAFEEKLEELYQRKAMFGSRHSYRRQEAIAVGSAPRCGRRSHCELSSRGTGHLIAKGADLYLSLMRMHGSRRRVFNKAGAARWIRRFGLWFS
jgi:TPP-dependent pyruvate/acetoin dehydrogenase alpha subunit